MDEGINPAARVREAMDRSELIRAASAVRQDGGRSLATGDAPLRPLAAHQIQRLEQLGNSAEDWARIQVAEGFNPETVRHSRFHGEVILGRFTAQVQIAPGVEISSGVYRSMVANCVIGHDALVSEVKLLGNYVVGAGAVLWNCAQIDCEAGTAFGNGRELALGIESGGREVAVFAELDVQVAAQVARSRQCRTLLREYAEAVRDYARQASSPRGIIMPGAMVRDTATVRNCYLGPSGRICQALLVSDCTVLSSADEPTTIESGACVRDSLIQWGCHVSTMALVDRSVLSEHSHVERHGKVTSSVLGPNTGVAAGEMLACLVGPFVGFHHQALLIAVLWPEGKGNVAYGANVGANHTSKAPDQEFWPGEGAFLGLGVNIKYPADFTRAPYAVISSGLTTLPQRVAFPFSLLNSPGSSPPGISPAYNEIVPAWLLAESLYALKRNEWKYRARNKSRRSDLEFDVFRPAIVDLMIDAVNRLEAVREIREVYTDREIDGLGKNFMMEKYRRPAIEAYRFHIRYYALLGLLSRVQRAVRDGEAGWDGLLSRAANFQPWEHQRRILLDEMSLTSVLDGLGALPSMIDKVAGDVERSKAKDDERGGRIIEDYADVHVPAERDQFVLQTWEQARRLKADVQAVTGFIESCTMPGALPRQGQKS